MSKDTIVADNIHGVIKFFIADKGYGFIISEDGDDIFVHCTRTLDGYRPQKGDEVIYSLATDNKNRDYAIDVRLV